ncbi:hypothetical protein C8N35_10294 [Breoghania corrubedonensis]|uniref:Uncharacterized protein n=1 Tax=Breoghania corrubedonensis TaxID=665038 RepID=A0A2T5VCB4_9HYPH|nr:hypothetical protein [Breoghania corrubedonensis]PTW61385.1 hypothetical protein C8N35_10294 [Breoghania corrubedonensis]
MTRLVSIYRLFADTTLPRDLAAALALALFIGSALVWIAALTGEM